VLRWREQIAAMRQDDAFLVQLPRRRHVANHYNFFRLLLLDRLAKEFILCMILRKPRICGTRRSE
jgi:hypothetical protein